MSTKHRFSVRAAVSSHLGYDVEDLKSYRYQPTRTPCEIYSDPRGSNQNFTATNGQRKPKESHDNFFGFWKWQEIEALGYAKTMGWRIWVNVEEDIE